MIYLLPNIFTTLNLFSGFFSIISSINHQFSKAGWAIFFAIVFDIFDGRIARHFNLTSKFGKEYDSLCDLVSFGVAPAILMYEFALKPFGKVGWLACFLYTACVALRLARFNVSTVEGATNFQGLPSPAGAAIVAATVLVLGNLKQKLPYETHIILILMCFVAYLFISSIEYPSFKEIRIKKGENFFFLIFFVLGLTLSAINPPLSFLIIIFVYTLIGPFLFVKNRSSKVVGRVIRKKKKNFKENLTK